MRRTIYCQTIAEAQNLARWACAFAKIPGGFICFESATDCASFRRGT
jgi:hypothetical protein